MRDLINDIVMLVTVIALFLFGLMAGIGLGIWIFMLAVLQIIGAVMIEVIRLFHRKKG